MLEMRDVGGVVRGCNTIVAQQKEQQNANRSRRRR